MKEREIYPHELKVGESAYTTSWAIKKNGNELELSSNYKLYRITGGTVKIELKRTSEFEFTYYGEIDASDSMTGTVIIYDAEAREMEREMEMEKKRKAERPRFQFELKLWVFRFYISF